MTQHTASSHAQYYLGWGGPVMTNPPQGAVRYLRMRFKAIGAVNLAGVGDVWTNKFIIVADGDNPTGRIICHLRDNGQTTTSLAIGCSRNIDGYPNATQNPVSLPSDQWISLQFEFRSSRSSSSNDGSIKIWKNTNNYGAPTTQSGLFQLNAIGWGAVSIGSYANATLSSQGRLVFQLADIVWDDEFDPNYSSGGSGGGTPPPSQPPAAPMNLRLHSSLTFGLFAGALGIMIISRRSKRD